MVELKKTWSKGSVIRFVKAMYSNVQQSSVQVNGSSSEPFKVMVGVHQGSVLSP